MADKDEKDKGSFLKQFIFMVISIVLVIVLIGFVYSYMTGGGTSFFDRFLGKSESVSQTSNFKRTSGSLRQANPLNRVKTPSVSREEIAAMKKSCMAQLTEYRRYRVKTENIYICPKASAASNSFVGTSGIWAGITSFIALISFWYNKALIYIFAGVAAWIFWITFKIIVDSELVWVSLRSVVRFVVTVLIIAVVLDFFAGSSSGNYKFGYGKVNAINALNVNGYVYCKDLKQPYLICNKEDRGAKLARSSYVLGYKNKSSDSPSGSGKSRFSLGTLF